MPGDDGGLVARWRLLLMAACDNQCSRADCGVLGVVLDRMNDDGLCWPSLKQIAEDAGITRPSAVKSVRRLLERGYLDRESGDRIRSNRYRMPRREMEPRRAAAPRREMEPQVGADRRLRVGADRRPEPTKQKQQKETTQERAPNTRKPHPTTTPPESRLPDWLPAEAWAAWRRHRGAKLTAESTKRAIAKLEKLRAEGHDPGALIDRAIEHGWAAFYPASQQTRDMAALEAVKPRHRAIYDPSPEDAAARNDAELRRWGVVSE